MSRWIVLILAFLIVGAVINVAVAGWFALSTRPMPVRDFRNLTSEEVRSLWDAWGPRPWSEVHRPDGMLQITIGRELLLVMAEEQPWPDRSTESKTVPDSFAIGRYSYGWPRRALGLVHVHDSTKPTATRDRILGGLPVTDKSPDLGASVVGAIPLQPLWGGFAVNTLLYTLVLVVAFAIPLAAIRYRRYRLGRCIRCGYPLGASVVCTECGRKAT